MAVSEKDLVVLNGEFEVVSYDGGAHEEDEEAYGIGNVLITRPHPLHCAKSGETFDLVLKYKKDGPFTLTHFMIRGGSNCTAPIKDGLLWVSKENPKVQDYSSKFNNFTQEQFNALERNGSEQEPLVFFSTEEESLEFQTELPKWVPGKYVHLKWLTRHDLGGENFDIAWIGLVGLHGEGHNQVALGPIPESFGITRAKLKQNNVNRLAEDFEATIVEEGTSFVLFSTTEAHIAAFKEVAQSGQYPGVYFFVSENADEDFVERLRDQFGARGDIALLRVGNSDFVENPRKKFATTDLTTGGIQQFLNDVKEGKRSPFLKSAARPDGDSAPAHPGLTIVVASSFKELIIDSPNDVLVDVYADWCGPCRAIAPKIARLAELLKDVPSISIAKFDCEENDIDEKYFPEPSIPNIKFFAAGKKDSPIKYSGTRTLSDFLNFITTNTTTKLELQDVISKAQKEEEYETAVKALRRELLHYEEYLEEFKDQLKEFDYTTAVEEYVARANDVLAKAETTLGDVQKLQQETKEGILSNFIAQSLKFKEEAEKAALKKVKKVHSEEEYNQLVGENKDKLVVVDFFATWCGPCVWISPVFAEFSDQFDDVLFIKVDVDELASVSKTAGVSAMPTFQFYKNGLKIDELVGASPEKLEQLIKQHKS